MPHDSWVEINVLCPKHHALGANLKSSKSNHLKLFPSICSRSHDKLYAAQ